MIDCVDIGTAIVAYIEPHAGAARDFNRWYERDHFYAALMAGPGAFSGARWVATRDCKQYRPPRGTFFGDPARGSYLTTAWLLPGMQAEWNAWVTREMDTLVADGRMFPGRDHLHTAVYRFVGDECDSGDMRAALALDRCFPGVVMIAFAPQADATNEALPFISKRVPVVTTFRQERLIVSALGDDSITDPDSHTLMLAFVDDDPVDVWCHHIEPVLNADDVLFASPFVRTIPGTDTYVDEL